MHDFSYEAGFLRRDYAIESNDYGDWAAVATHRYGVTDWLTLEGHAEAMADRGNLGGVVQVTMPVLGLVGVGGAVSGGARHRQARQGVLPAQRAELERRRRVAAAIRGLRGHRLRARADPHARHAPGLGIRAGRRAALAERAGAAHDRPDGRRSTPPRSAGRFRCTRSATLTANLSQFSGSLQPTNNVLLDHAGAAAGPARLRHRLRRAPQRPVGKRTCCST